tara:strand:+ start:478 stop:621 length:144 start_codon:yes stop_codon:yes gene_type:complete
MYIEKSFEFLEKQELPIRSEARKGTFNDHPEREYTQASGSGGNPKGL